VPLAQQTALLAVLPFRILGRQRSQRLLHTFILGQPLKVWEATHMLQYRVAVLLERHADGRPPTLLLQTRQPAALQK
jgi:hypothetical protein